MGEGAIHEVLSVETVKRGSSDLSFGFVMAGFFALLGLWPLVHRHDWRPRMVAVAVAWAVVALVRPSLLRPLNKLWTRLGQVLGRVVNPLVMGLFYYLVITPASWILRGAGKDLLKRRRDQAAASYWILRQPPGPAPETMSNQF